MYNLYSTEAQFKIYLISGNISTVSIRNYLSDFRYFCGWYQMTYGNEPIENKFNRESYLLKEYEKYLTSSNTPIKTVKRKLSTLRKYHGYLQSEGKVSIDKMRQSNRESNSEHLKDKSERTTNKLLSEFKYDLLMSSKEKDPEIEVMNVNDFISYISRN